MVNEVRIRKIRKVVENRQEGLVMVVEDVHDPHNIAAILRSCDAFGVQRICLIFDKQERYNPRKIGKSSSSSANKWLDFEVFGSTRECLQALKDERYEVVVTALCEKAQSIYNSDLKNRKIAIMVGNEHAGVTETALKMADKIVRIPMRGMVQSFNVSVSAALAMYEVTRQRMGNMDDYLLDKEKIEVMVKDFTDR